MARGAGVHEPLLAEAAGDKNKLSNCTLHETCFLSDGSRQHAQDQRRVQRKLLIACALCTVFMCVEVVGGYLAGSIAVLSDAAHMLSDVAGFAVSLFAAWAVTRRSHETYTFGYHRVEILGALVSVMTIWAVTGALVYEAFNRIINPEPVDGKVMFIVAAAGVGFNIVIALVLGADHVHGPGHSHDHGHGGHGHCHGHGHSHSHGHVHGSDSDDHSHGSHSDDDDHPHHGHDHSHDHGHRHGPGETSCCIITVPLDPNASAADANAATAAHMEAVIRDGDHEVVVAMPGANNHSHDHSHDHSHNHDHDHSSGHDHEHDHDHSHNNNHSHNHSCCHSHDHDHDHAHAHGHEQGQSHAHGKVQAGGIASRERKRGHSHDHSHNDSHGHGHSHENINLRSAVLHVIGDLLQSIGVAIAGALIWWKQDDARWQLADPICTFIFAGLVMLTSKNIIVDIFHTLMERTPQHLDVGSITSAMAEMEGVVDVHDLHVWHLSMGLPILTAHVHVAHDADSQRVLKSLERYVRSLGVRHSTIQICNPANGGAAAAPSAALPGGSGSSSAV